jgi:hypothetical protein
MFDLCTIHWFVANNCINKKINIYRPATIKRSFLYTYVYVYLASIIRNTQAFKSNYGIGRFIKGFGLVAPKSQLDTCVGLINQNQITFSKLQILIKTVKMKNLYIPQPFILKKIKLWVLLENKKMITSYLALRRF